MLLEVRNLSVSYGAVHALECVNIQMSEGEIVALIGPNGAGKSTCLYAISGLLELRGGSIDQGDILLNGERINDLQPYQLTHMKLCLVPEGRRIFPTMTILENLEMGAYTRKDKSVKEDIEKILGLFPFMKGKTRQRAGTLSSGEQQLLAIGRALMLKPALLLLDEPSLGLSPNYTETVFEKIEEINQSGTNILIVEQNARMALEYADRGYVFKIGEIFLEDTGENLLKSEQVRKAFLGE